MDVHSLWEHNGDDSLLWCVDLPGVAARGTSYQEAAGKLPGEIAAYLRWRDGAPSDWRGTVTLLGEKPSALEIRDADSDAILPSETLPLSPDEYVLLRDLALRSAADFLALYEAVPDKDRSCLPRRKTFYGQVPRTAREMYEHTKSVNAYYFGEIGVEADQEGTILDCRRRGFRALERWPDYLDRPAVKGSYGEDWSLRKVLRRFLWHDRIHAKAMYRMALQTFGPGSVPDPFRFAG